jgi:O-acetylserine/cysteine efflux transporter
MPATHIMLAVLVVAIWGTNFVVIRHGLAHFPPFTFAALRFALVALLLAWFVPRPKMSVAATALYGVLIGVGQFGLMLFAMAGHISPGLASVLIQTQAFFTVGLATLVNGERIGAASLLALCICAAGVAIVALNTGEDATWLGVLLVLGAALAWAAGNIVAKRGGTTDLWGLVVWSSLFAAAPLIVAALLIEGPDRVAAAVTQAPPSAWAIVLWQSFGNAVFGYGVWNWLLARHPASEVAPMSLLVPIFGMSASAWLLGESMPAWKLAATALVLAGLLVNLASSRRPLPPVAA